MSGITIDVIYDDRELSNMLSRVKARVSDMMPVMQTIGETVRASVVKNFRSGGCSQHWPKSGRVKAAGGQTLLDTGRLRNSFSVSAFRNSVEVGTNMVYAAVHHFGAKKFSFGTFAVEVKSHTRTINQAFRKPLAAPGAVNACEIFMQTFESRGLRMD